MKWPTFNAKDKPLGVVVKLSRYYGSDPSIVLAGGGNTSVKVGDRLFVKASGHALATIGPKGFVEMDRSALAAIADEEPPKNVNERETVFKNMIMMARVHPEMGQRPSVEVVLHHLAPGRYVVHSHSTLANMIACCRRGEELVGEVFGDVVLWVPYVDPGYLLARSVQDLLRDYQEQTGRPQPKGILMQNHGLIVSGDSPGEIRRQMNGILGKIRKRIARTPGKDVFGSVHRISGEESRTLIETIAPALRVLLAENDNPAIVTFDDSEAVISLAGGKEGRPASGGGPMTPEQIVYSKSAPLWFTPKVNDGTRETVAELRRAVNRYSQKRKCFPSVVVVEGLGLFSAGKDFKSADRARELYVDAIKIMAGATRLGGSKPMSKRASEFIENWEVESYRRSISAGEGRGGRAEGKIAVVTGAAQGFGLGIAEDLADQGAYVVLLDVNGEGAAAAAKEVCRRTEAGRSIGLATDVTDGASIKAAIHRIVRTYGGFDLFVSNAGVLRAESVKTQPVKDFELVTSVNYKGYFLCVQNAAPILAVQHTANPRYRGDIIQINSKSGLIGSNRNSAYAGSKFGGIGLTQSFAMELIEDGIKVNSICPGNYFDGPLWSDPENGLFVQYLRARKVPGAKTIEDVRKAYEAKAPMGRGCTIADVMQALYYLMDQQYETGQALPVTGGQVMLS
jgi:rhamnose utilization protein RhaD (predicted bifunctional aldolase and dehydrogenase)/NAD(P)-dependent dehydrogenase (short-subunit alcohol dehydrogenase family)